MDSSIGLEKAIRANDVSAVVKLTLAHSPEMKVGGVPLLCLAARHGSVDVVRELLVAGARPDLSSWSGETALHLAAEHGHVSVCQVILRHSSSDVDVNVADANGRTPLYVAAFRGHTAVCECLLEAGADWRVRDFDGWSVDGWSVFTAAAVVKQGLFHCDIILKEFECLVSKREKLRVTNISRLLCAPPLALPVLVASIILSQCSAHERFDAYSFFPSGQELWKLCTQSKTASNAESAVNSK